MVKPIHIIVYAVLHCGGVYDRLLLVDLKR